MVATRALVPVSIPKLSQLMNAVIKEVDLAVIQLSQVAAQLTARVGLKLPPGGLEHGKIAASVYEVGVDGSQPDAPCAEAVATTWSTARPAIVELPIQLGTPFLANRRAQPRYALRVTWDRPDRPAEGGEQLFRLATDGQLVLLENFKAGWRSPSRRPPHLPALFVVGDSTAYSNGPGQRGWGDELMPCLDPATIQVLNRARPGRSTRSYRREGLWQRVLAELAPGDLVLIQFGHNDADLLAEGRCRGVLPGDGETTQSVCLPDGRQETVLTYGAYLRQFVMETRARGALPVLLSLTVRNRWRGEKLADPASDYGRWSAIVAGSAGIPFLDLEEFIRKHYQILGQEPVSRLFCSVDDHVHTSVAGARLNAAGVAAGLKQLRLLPQPLKIDRERTAR